MSDAWDLRGGLVADGTGSPPRRADVAIRAGRINAVGAFATDRAATVIDAAGAVVAPGFIDLHSHGDFTLPVHPGADAAVHQGVTTQVLGNCGLSPFPTDAAGLLRGYAAFLDAGLEWCWHDATGYAAHLEGRRPATNTVLQVGHGAARLAALGFAARPAAPDERAAVAAQVAAALDAGASGVSLGLRYPPGASADALELAAVCAEAARRGAFCSAHIRDEGAGLLGSIREVLALARDCGVALQVSHLKAMGRAQQGGRAQGGVLQALALLDEARAAGQDVAADAYPYEATSTTLLALLPRWVSDAGPKAAAAMARDPALRPQVSTALAHDDFPAAAVEVAHVPAGPLRWTEGLSLADAARRLDRDPMVLVLDLLATSPGGVQIVHHALDPADVRAVLAHPAVAVASDGWVQHPSAGGRPHPRSYGTFARVLGRFVREEAVLTLEDAVRKMTGLPAARLGFDDRGVLRPGAVADLVVFDPARIRDTATYRDPHRFAEGVEHVFVAGRPVLGGGALTGARPGRVLRSTRTAT